MTPRLTELATISREAAALALTERGNLSVELKGDRSLVTNVDRAVETFLRKRLLDSFPGTTVWGEEFGYAEPGENGLWLIDPIDGTSNFTYGSPLWGVSIALYLDGQITLGSVILPDLSEEYFAQLGEGAWFNGSPMSAIPAGPIQPFELVTINGHLGNIPAGAERVPGKRRDSGAFVIDGTFFAKQRFRALVGQGEHLYDVAACVLLATELGAEVGYLDGTPFRLEELAKLVPINRPWGMFPAGSGILV